MRHFVILFISLLSLSSFAGETDLGVVPPETPQQLQLVLDASPNDIPAPVVVKGAKDGEAQFGVFTAESTPQKMDALTILRNELNRQEAIEQAKAHQDGVFWSTTKRFTPESLTFFIAIGAVTFNSMWIKSQGDPLAMQRHILSLKDPIAHLSFYAFMQTQGFYMNFHTASKGFAAMDASTRTQMMRRLSYQGMAIGSLASSIVADLGQSVKMCVNQWIKGKTDEESLASCNQAWKNWTVREKFTQYFPQIISMWASQAATELIESSASKVFSRVVVTSFVKKLLTKEFLVKQAYKISAADVVLTFGGGGWFTKSLKFVGKVTRFGLFVGVDHVLSNYTYRPVNNLIKPALFDFDALSINKLWHEADEGSWDSAKIKNTENLPKFEKEIEGFGKDMQQWRDHLNADAETDLAGWMEMTKQILNQIDYSYKFYKGFADTMFETLSTGYQIQHQQLAPSAATIISRYPLRELPFYGVSTGAYKAIGGKVEDFYLLNPNELEKRQREHILDVATQINASKPALKNPREQGDFNKIIEKLVSKDDKRMSSGLNDINQTIALYELEMSQEHPYSMTSYEFIGALRDLKKILGNPQPVVYPLAGYSQAFTAYSVNQVIADAADFSKWSILQKYKFNKEADLMMFRLVCGQNQGRLHKISLVGVNILAPQFEPPGLLLPNSDRSSYCSSIKTTDNLYSSEIGGKSLRDYVLANANYSIIGDYRGKADPNQFERWWIANAKTPIAAEFKDFDVKFKKVFDVAYDNFFDHRSFFKFFVDQLNQSKYLPKSLEASLKFESNLYLQILNRVLIPDAGANPNAPPPPPPPQDQSIWTKISDVVFTSPYSKVSNAIMGKMTDFNYVEYATKNSEEINYTSLYKKAPKEIVRLNNLLAAYYVFIINQDVNFDQYIAYSKKIDTAINDVLVLAGLKKVTQATSSDEVEDLSAPASASGSESSANIYEDIPVQNPTYKQRMTVAAVKGLRLVESEIRRFIRMRITLSQSLEVDAKEFMADWNNANPSQGNSGASGKVNPFGTR